MSDFISRSELIKDLMKQIPLAENVHIFRDIIDSQPSVADNEIRDKAIDTFAEAIKCTLPIAVHRDCSEVDYEVDCALYVLRNRIDRIAAEIKECKYGKGRHMV